MAKEEMVTFGDVQIPLWIVQLRDELNAAQARWGWLHEFKEGVYFRVETADDHGEWMIPFADAQDDHRSFGEDVGIEQSMQHIQDAISGERR